MKKLNPETLDKLESFFLKQLTDSGGAAPAAKLDIIRKLLEKNNRLYVKPNAKDPGPRLDSISSTDSEDSPCNLPFETRH